MSRDDFQIHQRTLDPAPGAGLEFISNEHRELAIPTTAGPGYDPSEVPTLVRNRYERCLPTVKFTLQRLIAQPAFCAVIRKMRAEGWKDWHLLMSIATIAGNARANMQHASRDPREQQRLVMQFMSQAETPTSPPLPDDLFTETALRQQLHMNMLSSAKGFGLELHQEAPDITGIEQLLITRYRYRDDDIEHPPIFGPCLR